MKALSKAVEPLQMMGACWLMFGLFAGLALFLHFLVMPVFLDVYGDFGLAERIWKWRTYPGKAALVFLPITLTALLYVRQRPSRRRLYVLGMTLLLSGWGFWAIYALFTPHIGLAERVE